jgi:hypothetical protein
MTTTQSTAVKNTTVVGIATKLFLKRNALYHFFTIFFLSGGF